MMNSTPASRAVMAGCLAFLVMGLMPDTGYAKKKGRKSKEPEVSLPALASEDGAPSEAYVTYDSPYLSATVTRQGGLRVLPKTTTEGTGQIKPISIGFPCCYKTDTKPPKRKTRKVTAFPNPPEPVKDPKEVILEREHADGVTSTVTYTFSAREVSAEVVFKDPPKLAPPSYCMYTANIPASHLFPPETTIPERAAATKGYSLAVSGKKLAYNSLKGPGGKISSASISGQWPGRTVKVSLKDAGTFDHYTGSPLYSGYSLEGRTEKKSGNGKITVSVE